jgi:23S rRNA (guanine2445-N2)-methyltransferase / 23S rRNA (guanine2069-N7)-methyltransferase
VSTSFESYIATCPKGLEHQLGLELARLGAVEVQESVAACYFKADLATSYKVCLWSRLANRVALLLLRNRIDSEQALYDSITALPWSSYFSADKTLLVDFNGTSADIRDSRFGAKRVKDAINDSFLSSVNQRLVIDEQRPDILVYGRLFNGRFTLALDLVGESLHQRGYRSRGGAAPLKENLAAAILLQSDWPAIAESGGSFVDPMCGSGTLLIEAALIAANIPPTFLRARGLVGNGHWCLTQFSNYDDAVWQQVMKLQALAADEGCNQLTNTLLGFDIDPRTVALANENIALAGLTDCLTVKVTAIDRLSLPDDILPGLLVVNPPYGERLGEVDELIPVYQQLGRLLKQSCMGWQASVFTGNKDLGWQTGLRSWRQHRLYNGAIECQVQRYRVDEKSIAVDLTDRGKKVLSVDDLSDNATMLANRLIKNRRRLKPWLKKQSNACYRVYDADLPEYAMAIDCYVAVEKLALESDDVSGAYPIKNSGASPYKNVPTPLPKRATLAQPELHIHLQEYAPPATVDVGLARKRVKDAIAAVSAVFECPLEQIYLKRRERQRGNSQYQKTDASDQALVVLEHGHAFKINLQRYLDSGLFLDHRPVRLLIAKEVAGKRFLNLFSYTGSASVYAAKAGASQSLSIDMSNNYLNWTRHNFELNAIDCEQHELLRADCSEWLKTSDMNFDCILLDPPSFSNSKRMDHTLDISRDHIDLISLAMRRLTAEGSLYFSNNKRGFKLAPELTRQFAVEDLTRATLDPDFERGRPAHQCWRLKHR